MAFVRVRRARSIRLTLARRWFARCAWMAPLLVSFASLAAGTARARDGRADAELSRRASIGVLIFEDPSTDWGQRVRGQLSDLPASAEIR